MIHGVLQGGEEFYVVRGIYPIQKCRIADLGA